MVELRGIASLGSTKMPQDYRRDAALAITGRAVDEKHDLRIWEIYDLLNMLGLTETEEAPIQEEQEIHDYQSKYRHYRSIGVA